MQCLVCEMPNPRIQIAFPPGIFIIIDSNEPLTSEAALLLAPILSSAQIKWICCAHPDLEISAKTFLLDATQRALALDDTSQIKQQAQLILFLLQQLETQRAELAQAILPVTTKPARRFALLEIK